MPTHPLLATRGIHRLEHSHILTTTTWRPTSKVLFCISLEVLYIRTWRLRSYDLTRLYFEKMHPSDTIDWIDFWLLLQTLMSSWCLLRRTRYLKIFPPIPWLSILKALCFCPKGVVPKRHSPSSFVTTRHAFILLSYLLLSCTPRKMFSLLWQRLHNLLIDVQPCFEITKLFAIYRVDQPGGSTSLVDCQSS